MNVNKIYINKLFIIFPPYHIEAAQTPVCVVSVFLRAFLYGQIRPFYGIFRHFAFQKSAFFERILSKNALFLIFTNPVYHRF